MGRSLRSEKEGPMDPKELVNSRGNWFVWVLEYGITHGVMRLALHEGDFPRHHELVCGGAIAFRGKLQGGPYRLRLDVGVDSTVPIVLRDAEDQFELSCANIELGRVRR